MINVTHHMLTRHISGAAYFWLDVKNNKIPF